MTQTPPLQYGSRSPDGQYWWDGAAWQPVPAAAQPAPPAGAPPAYGQPAYAPSYAPPGYGQPAYALSPVAYPAPLATAGRRFVGALLTIPLFIVTLGIGYIIWDLITWQNAQTPAMKILKMQVVKKDTGRPATWGTMFLRGFVGYGIIQTLLNQVLIGYVLLFMIFWDSFNQELWDKIGGTVVLDMRAATPQPSVGTTAPAGALPPPPSPPPADPTA